ncbi:hypothetical protein DSO57_1038671 [Entomophthora muscae]|uniref:Uncharacterized protein n=1 Tax=Entomophthora muscae TaxID=34485 RepID=A0ACC2SBC2_9FUNG|nr:hypothetical protein DSO57_1038671 [Entomophthora muscae]
MPRNHYLIAGIVYFCINLNILFASIWESTTQYNIAYPYPPGYTTATPVDPPHTLDLEYYLPHHLDLPPAMKEIPAAPPTQCASCPGLHPAAGRAAARQLSADRTPSLAACLHKPAASQSPTHSPSQPAGDSASPMAGLSIPARWRNFQIRNPKKTTSPNPKRGGTAA